MKSICNKEVQRNISIEIKPEIIPFHDYVDNDLIPSDLNEEEKVMIVDGEFRKALSEKGLHN